MTDLERENVYYRNRNDVSACLGCCETALDRELMIDYYFLGHKDK